MFIPPELTGCCRIRRTQRVMGLLVYYFGSHMLARRVVLNITLRLFASYRERVGRSALDLRMPEGATAGSVARWVVDQYPGIVGGPSALVIAVNQEYQDHNYELSDGDEVALIPPVSGGRHD